jgi:hypothetical protein
MVAGASLCRSIAPRSQVSAIAEVEAWRTGGLADSVDACFAIAGVNRNEMTLKHHAVVEPALTSMQASKATSMPPP